MVNDQSAVAELTAMHEAYEAALIANDIGKLTAFFWDSEYALRFGVSECLYGAREIEAFRRNRGPVNLEREVLNLRIATFGGDTGIVTLEFMPKASYGLRRGRQSQCWRKFEDGWKIVSAHVSLIPNTFAEQAGAIARLPIPPEMRKGVNENLQRAAVIARPLLDFVLDPAIETGPVFRS